MEVPFYLRITLSLQTAFSYNNVFSDYHSLPNGRLEFNMNKPRILIAGGDMRQIYCACRLSCEFEISIIGFDKMNIPDNIDLSTADIRNGRCFDCAVLPISPLDSDGNISTPFGSEVLSADTVAHLLKDNAVVFAGKVSSELKTALPNNEILDYMLSEELNIKNAIPTAEGAVQLALEELACTLNGMKILVTGTGRISTALIRILQGFGADITAAVHNPNGVAKARLLGVKSVPVRKLSGDWSLVFNTVPKLILDKDTLKSFNKDTLFIDLASKPGGIDFEAAVELGLKVIWALGIPGKTAPVTSGEIIAETVSSILNERSGENE